MPTKTQCFGFANIITRIRIQIRDKLHKDPDPEGKQLKRKFFKLISNKPFTNVPANLDKVKNNNNNTNNFFKILIFAFNSVFISGIAFNFSFFTSWIQIGILHADPDPRGLPYMHGDADSLLSFSLQWILKYYNPSLVGG